MLLLLRYARDVRDISHWKEIYYFEDVTALAVEEKFDLRLHDKFHVDVYKTSPSSKEVDYHICVCQRQCNPRKVIRKPLDLPDKSYDASDHDVKTIFEQQYMVTGSEVTISFTPPVNRDLTDITLNIFTNATKCQLFLCRDCVEVSPDLPPVTLNKNNGFQTNLKAENDSYFCAAAKFQDAGHYSYTITGTIITYQNVSHLIESGSCDLHYCQTCRTNENSCIPDTSLSRSLGSLLASQPQLTCIYFTVSDTSTDLYINVSTTVFGTNQNINIVTPSLVGCVLIMLACGFIIGLCVMSRRSY